MPVTPTDLLEALRYHEPLSRVAQTKLKLSELQLLDKVVDWVNAQGVKASRSSVIRALIVEGVREAFEQRKEELDR